MEKKVYQIEVVKATKQELIDNIVPDGLFSFDVFETKKEAEEWLKHNSSDDVIEYKIVELNENDIEEYRIITTTDKMNKMFDEIKNN